MKRDRDDKKKTRFVRYKEGAALYSMCQTKFERLAKDANAITFKRGEDTVETVFTKAPNFSMQTLMDAVAKWNPRINVYSK